MPWTITSGLSETALEETAAVQATTLSCFVKQIGSSMTRNLFKPKAGQMRRCLSNDALRIFSSPYRRRFKYETTNGLSEANQSALSAGESAFGFQTQLAAS